MGESYNSNSLPQLAAIQSSISFIEQAIDVLDIVPSFFPIISADFGSSHGVNSMYATKTIIDYINDLNELKIHFWLSIMIYQQTTGQLSSIQWFSRKPCNISNHCLSLFAKDEQLAAFKTQVQHDYAQFLENRSRELIKSGVLILSVDEEGKMPYSYACYYLYECAKLLPLTEQQVLDYTIPIYLRSYKEYLDGKREEFITMSSFPKHSMRCNWDW